MTIIHMRSAAVIAALNVTSSKNGTTGNQTAPSLGVPNDVQQLWAQYTPWFSADHYKSPPDGCEIVQVNLLQRHGARFPEQAAAESIQKSVEKIKNVEIFSDPKYEFVKTYTYSLGVSDLVPFGAAQSFDAGQDHYTRYANLVNDTMLPFVRATSSNRVVDSANNWTAGFAKASKSEYAPKLSVILSETGNNTLDNKMCPAVGSSKNETTIWAKTFTPKIVDYFNQVAAGVNLNGSDVVNFMALCAFDTVAKEKASPWCNLFSDDDWSSFEYYGDLDTYYGTGYGQKLGRVQGVGYVNELIARLTGQSVRDETQTNHTLDDSPETFPMNRTFYADFTHDNEMIAIYSTLGLFNQTQDLDPTKADNTTWAVSHLVPFSARMITEKLKCKGVGSQNGTKSLVGKGTGSRNGNGTGTGTGTGDGDEYVRVLVNDVVQKLEFCDGDENGLCSLSKFVESQDYAQENGKGDWELCFEGSKDPGKGKGKGKGNGSGPPSVIRADTVGLKLPTVGRRA